MALGGVNLSSIQLYSQRREKLTTEKAHDTRNQAEQSGLEGDAEIDQAGESPAALMQRFSAAATEMSALLTQIRPRRDSDKKMEASDEGSFEKVLDEESAAKADQMLKIVHRAPSEDISRLLQQLQHFLPDESDLVLVLREWLKKKDLDEINRRKIEQLLKKAEEQADPRRLKAGINVAIKARLFSKKLKMTPALIRESYRQFLESEQSADVTYHDWIMSYGMEYRAIITDFMESALLADIDSLDPSCSIPEFGSLLLRMYQIKLIRSSEWLFINGLLQHEIIFNTLKDESIWLLLLLNLLNESDDVASLLSDIFDEYNPEENYTAWGEILQHVYRAWGKIPSEVLGSEGAEKKHKILKQMEEYATLIHAQELIEKRMK